MTSLRTEAGWVLACLLLPWLLLWPAPLVFTTDVLAAPDQEAVQHLWGLWAALEAADPLTVTTDRLSWPTGFEFVLIDPGNLPWFALGSLLGPVAAFNLVLLAGVAVCGAAGSLLGRVAGLDPAGRALAAVAAMSSTALLSNAGEGITESFAVGWAGLALGALLMHLRAPSSASVPERWGWGALAALSLAAAVYGGPYNGLWAALLCGAVGLAHLGDWRRTVPVGLAGAVLASPAIAIFAAGRPDGLPGTAVRQSWARPVLDPEAWRGGNLAGADLLDLWLPGGFGGEVAHGHTAYLGVVAIGLAVVAVARDRRRWPWLAGAAAFAVLSLGIWLSFHGGLVRAGDGVVLTPVGLAAKAFPPLLRFSRWYRAASVAGLLLAPLVAAALSRGRVVVGALLVADACLIGPRAWPVPHFDARPSPIWGALDEPGAVVDLPPVQWAFVPEGGVRDANLLQQTWHGRASSGTFLNLSGGAADSVEVGALFQAALGKGVAGHAPQRLADMGYRYVVVDRTRFERLAEPNLEAVLGRAIVSDRQYLAYRLPDPRGEVVPSFPPFRTPIPPPGSAPGDGAPPSGRAAPAVRE